MNLALRPLAPPVPGPFAFTTPDLLAVLKAVSAAWEYLPSQLVGRRAFSSQDYEDEDLVTHHLVEILCQMHSTRHLDYFTADRFEQPSRDAKVANHNGRRTELMPDIVFRTHVNAPYGAGRQFGLFTECKVIGTRRKRVPLYVHKGISKFLNGDYAWSMGQALMIAYVVGPQRLPGSLDDYTRSRCAHGRNSRYLPKGGLVRPAWAGGHLGLDLVHAGIHSRRFLVQGRRAADLEILHLWLQRP